MAGFISMGSCCWRGSWPDCRDSLCVQKSCQFGCRRWECKETMNPIHKRFGEIPALFFCLILWVVLFCLILIVSGNRLYLQGFLLGAAGSAIYAYLLYRRIPVLLKSPLAFKTALPQTDRASRQRPANLKYLWSGWRKTIQPIVSVVLIILAVSHFSQSVSFLAALFGFFSFQISLFLYAALTLIFDFIQGND